MPRHTKKTSHENRRNNAQSPLYVSDQQENSMVPIGSSTSAQDATSNDVISPLSPSRCALLIAFTRFADADNQNPDVDFFDLLGNPIPNGDTLNNENENDAKDLTGVEEYENNQHEIPGVTTQEHQEETPGVTTTEEEEEIQEMEIPEDQNENKEIAGVDQNTEDPGVNINNAMPGNPPEPTSTNENNMPKAETVDEYDSKEDENENEEAIQDEEGL